MGASIPGHSCMACWEPQALREGEAEGGGQASSCTCGRRGSGDRARGGCISLRLALGVCAVLGICVCPGRAGQVRAEAGGRGHPGAVPGFLRLGGSTQWQTLCPQAWQRVHPAPTLATQG